MGSTKGSKTVMATIVSRRPATCSWELPGLLPVKSTAMSEFGFTAMKGGIFHIINNACIRDCCF